MKRTKITRLLQRLLLICLLSTVSFISTVGFLGLASASGDSPLLAVEPGNYTARQKGETFSINVTISEVNASSRLVGLNFRLHYNLSFLEFIEWREGNFFEPYATLPNSTGVFYTFHPPESGLNAVQVGILLRPDENGIWHPPFPSGNGTLLSITFKVTGGPPRECRLRLSWTKLIDPELNEIPHTVEEPATFDFPVETLTQLARYMWFRYPVVTASNSSVLPFEELIRFDDRGLLRFNVSGRWPNTTRFCNITIPRELLYSNFSVKVDGGSTPFSLWQNSTHSTLHFEYDAGTHQIDIMGKTVLPKLTEDISLDVEVDVGKIHYRGELAEFYALTKFNGNAVNATITKATLYYSNGTASEDLTDSARQIATGLYRIPYEIPVNAPTGIYTLVITATHPLPMMIDETVFEIDSLGTSFKAFLISPTLLVEQAQISAIEDDIATIIIPNIGMMKANLTTIGAELDEINGSTAWIRTNLGIVKTDIENIGLKVTEIDGTTVTLTSKLGEIEGTVSTIHDDIAEVIVPGVGTIEADVSDIKGAQEDIKGGQATLIPPLYAAVVLALIAAVGAIMAVALIRRKG